jgi:hypothetical protein
MTTLGKCAVLLSVAAAAVLMMVLMAPVSAQGGPGSELASAAWPRVAAAVGPAAATDTTGTDAKSGATRGIFIPKLRGAGDTLDDVPDATAPQTEQIDFVTTVRGDRLRGSVMGIGPRGALRVTTPDCEGEVLLTPAQLERVVLRTADDAAAAGRPVPAQTAEIVMTSGDRAVGSLVSIEADAVTIDTAVAGRLRIATSAVQWINLQRPRALIDSVFATGVVAPWIDMGQGAWSPAEGGIMNRGGNLAGAAAVRFRGEFGGLQADLAANGAEAPIYAPLTQTGAVTIVAKISTVAPVAGRTQSFSCDLVLFADAPGGSSRLRRYGQSSVFGVFTQSQAYPISNIDGGSGRMVGSRSYSRMITSGTLRFAYDPATNMAHMWLDDLLLGAYQMPKALTSGKFVMFNASGPVKLESLRVLSGVVKPEDDGFFAVLKDLPAAGEMSVELASKERMTVTKATLANGQLTLTTATGVIHPAVADVRQIVFAHPASAAPEGQGQVRTDSSWLTMQLERITDAEISGRSDVFGEVKVRRAAVREIRYKVASN